MTVRAARLSGVLAQRQGMNVLNDYRRRMPDVHSYSRTGAATGRTAAGLILPFAENEAQRTDRGLVLEPQRTNLLVNSALAGGVSGTPGTAPTSWAQFPVNSPTATYSDDSRYAGGNRMRIVTGATGRLSPRQTVSALANTTYVASAVIDVNTAVAFWQMLAFVAFPAGTALTYFVDGVSVAGGSIVGVGTRTLEAVAAVAATTGNLTPAFGMGVQSGLAGDARHDMPQFEVGARRSSYIPTTTATATRGLPALTEPVPPGRTRALLTFADSTTLTVTGLTPGGTFDVAAPVLAAGKGISGVSELVTREWLA